MAAVPSVCLCVCVRVRVSSWQKSPSRISFADRFIRLFGIVVYWFVTSSPCDNFLMGLLRHFIEIDSSDFDISLSRIETKIMEQNLCY